MAAVRTDGRKLANVPRKTFRICMAAVQQNGYAIQHVPYTPECRSRIKSGDQISDAEYIRLCMAAVQQNALVIRHVLYQTYDLCMTAIQQNIHALEHIIIKRVNNPSGICETDYIKICHAALDINADAFVYIQNTLGMPMTTGFDEARSELGRTLGMPMTTGFDEARSELGRTSAELCMDCY
jgi:hypothetical protein